MDPSDPVQGAAGAAPTYRPAIAVRLSGLSERSSGDGCDRRTVNHALAAADFQAGRLARKSGQFFCRAWQPWDVSEQVPGTAITCERCAELVARLHAVEAAPQPRQVGQPLARAVPSSTPGAGVTESPSPGGGGLLAMVLGLKCDRDQGGPR